MVFFGNSTPCNLVKKELEKANKKKNGNWRVRKKTANELSGAVSHFSGN